jgi:hypothetical protein
MSVFFSFFLSILGCSQTGNHHRQREELAKFGYSPGITFFFFFKFNFFWGGRISLYLGLPAGTRYKILLI